MIPIPIVWTEYTAVLRGRVMKLVCCEGCQSEYVYELEREGEGAGKSLYMLDEAGAEERAKKGAEEALQSYLENDFDPIPCPVCGHYQRYMFPKLYKDSPLIQFARVVVIAVGCVAGLGAMYWTVTYLEQPGDRALWRMVANWSLLAALALLGVGLRALERAQARRFDPNSEDQQARIAKGRQRAVTRAEFEAAQQNEQDARDRFIEHLRQKARQEAATGEKDAPPPDSGLQ